MLRLGKRRDSQRTRLLCQHKRDTTALLMSKVINLKCNDFFIAALLFIKEIVYHNVYYRTQLRHVNLRCLQKEHGKEYPLGITNEGRNENVS